MPQKSDDSKDRPGQSRWLGFVQIVLILAVIAVALYFARAPERIERETVSALSPEDTRPVVSVMQPERAGQSLTVELTGAVGLSERARVKSEVAGRVIWVSPGFSNGGSIEANEPFVKIDPTEYELRAKVAEMAVESAEARVRIAKARGEENARGFAREYPDAEASDWVRRLPHIARAEAELMKARAELELARLELDRTNISLPYPSRVIRSRIEVGEYVGPDLGGESPLLGVVYRTRALQIDAPIEPKDLQYLNPVIGRSAEVRTRGGTYDARIVRVSSVVAPQSRLATVFLRFSEDHAPDSLPLPGTFARIAIAGPSYEDVFVLPESTLQEHGSVWVVQDGTLRGFEPETLGRTDKGWVVEVFDAGEGVVVGALPGAREGLAVTVAQAASSG
jgi:RND family efflux transporter MFP subunit